MLLFWLSLALLVTGDLIAIAIKMNGGYWLGLWVLVSTHVSCGLLVALGLRANRRAKRGRR